MPGFLSASFQIRVQTLDCTEITLCDTFVVIKLCLFQYSSWSVGSTWSKQISKWVIFKCYSEKQILNWITQFPVINHLIRKTCFIDIIHMQYNEHFSFQIPAWKELGSESWVRHGVVLLVQRLLRSILKGLTMTVWLQEDLKPYQHSYLLWIPNSKQLLYCICILYLVKWSQKKKKFHTKETFRFLNSTYVCVLEIDLAAFPLHPAIVLWLTLCLGLFTPQIQCTHMGHTHFQSITRPNLFIRTFKLHTKWNSSTVVFLDAVSWKLSVQDRKCVPYWYTESNNEADNYIQCVQSRNW